MIYIMNQLLVDNGRIGGRLYLPDLGTTGFNMEAGVEYDFVNMFGQDGVDRSSDLSRAIYNGWVIEKNPEKESDTTSLKEESMSVTESIDNDTDDIASDAEQDEIHESKDDFDEEADDEQDTVSDNSSDSEDSLDDTDITPDIAEKLVDLALNLNHINLTKKGYYTLADYHKDADKRSRLKFLNKADLIEALCSEPDFYKYLQEQINT